MDIQPGLHWPYCIDHSCIGCLPALDLPEPKPPLPDLSNYFEPVEAWCLPRR